MNDDKVLVNIRITKERKKQLEYLAKEQGVSVTKYFDLLILSKIEDTLKLKGYREAFEQAAIEIGIDKDVAHTISSGSYRAEDFEKIMDKELYAKMNASLYEHWLLNCVGKCFEEFGLDYTKIKT